MEAYSVLMTVYQKENPRFFVTAIESILNQTVQTDDFVIVCDGPLTLELDAVIEKYCKLYPQVFHIVRLPENVGIGSAANAGLSRCKHDLVARMDADDIAVSCRCEKQLQRFEACDKLQVVGGFIEEFNEDPDEPFSVRVVPLENEEIRTFARRRQPFNNVTVMYRRSAVQAVGGYRKLTRGEDFDLFIRMLHAGYYAGNIGEVLVKVRVNQSAMSRRASWATLKGCAQSRWNSYRLGYASLLDVIVCVGGELVIMISPAKLQHFIYSKFLRKQTN